MTIRTGIKRIYGKNSVSRSHVLEIAHALRKNSIRKFGPITTVKSGQSDIQLIEKMDGSYCRFGIDNCGVFFLQSSNSIPANVNNFTEVFKNLPDFKESFSCLIQLNHFQEWCLKLFKKIGEFAISAEIFPLLTHEGNDDCVIFCGTKYLKNNLGEEGAFVTFDVTVYDNTSDSYIGLCRNDSEQIQQELHDLSVETFGSIWRVMPNHMYCYLNKEIAFNLVELADIVDNNDLYESSLRMLRSSTQTPEKAELVSKIECGRKSMQESLDKFADELKSFLSDDCHSAEGVILALKVNDNEFFLKGTSSSFDLIKNRLWYHRQLYLDIDRKIDVSLLQNHFGFSKTSPVFLNKQIRGVLDVCPPSIDFERKFYKHFLDKLNPLLKFSFSVLQELIERFRETREDFEVTKHDFDRDTVRKTHEIQDRVLTRILYLEQLGSESELTMQQQISLLRNCLGRRINRLVNFETGNGAPQDDLDSVVVWVGRAQPWHKGHHYMIMECLNNLATIECDKILILLVHGDESCKDKDKNPLSFQLQLEALNTLYGDDDRIIIHNGYIKSAYVPNVLSTLYRLNMRLGGWVCGPDRIPSYKESLRRFNVQKFLLTHSYCPLSKDDVGNSCIEFIRTERVFSGTESRSLSRTMEFDEWFSATVGLGDNAKESYSKIYKCLRETYENLQKNIDTYMLPSMG